MAVSYLQQLTSQGAQVNQNGGFFKRGQLINGKTGAATGGGTGEAYFKAGKQINPITGMASVPAGANATTTEEIINGEEANQLAAIAAEEQAMTMRLNEKASENTNQLAMSQGQRRTPGGGVFRGRNVTANSALAGLSSVNARNVADAKRKQLATSLKTPTGKLEAQANYVAALRKATGKV